MPHERVNAAPMQQQQHTQDAITENVIPGLLAGEEARGRQRRSTLRPAVIRLCDASVCHVATGARDAGWGCGLRNAQMLWTYLAATAPYAAAAARVSPAGTVPSLRRLQELVDAAWAAGFDPAGAALQPGGRRLPLTGTRAWVGPVELACALRHAGIRARIADFDRGSAAASAQALLHFAWQYFAAPHTVLQHMPRLHDVLSSSSSATTRA